VFFFTSAGTEIGNFLGVFSDIACFFGYKKQYLLQQQM